jgi:hypothetical protein
VTHFQGLPITPEAVAATVLPGRHAFVSYANPEQIGIALEVCESVAADNGAYPKWKRGAPTDWPGYYGWTGDLIRHPAFAFAIIPDVIEGAGGEADNDALVREWPHGKFYGVPVWHLHESLARLERLAADWPRVALGSSGEFSDPGSPSWWNRMAEALPVVCDADGRPLVKLHGLRMLDPEIVSRVPFASADSTNIGRNIGIDSKWTGAYQPPSKAARAVVLAQRIEAVNSPARWAGRPVQQGLWGRVA